MAILTDYRQFKGRHAETGSVHNLLAYSGVKAPHTGQPYSEAFLLGVSGGITFGYFTFDYEGYPPILSLLTRNTFDPMQTMLERLGIVQNIEQTSNPATGEKNLLEALQNGRPALVWADVVSLPYYGFLADEKMYDMQPLVVYGLEDGTAYLADRSEQAQQISAQTLATARARIKKDKFRVVTLDPPDEGKLTSAVQQGLWQCIRLYTEKPPRGTRDNFGFAAYQKWVSMLTNTRNPQSWERLFAPGKRMFSALAGSFYLPGAYGWICHWGTGTGADRFTFADFLDEAAVLLKNPGLEQAGEQFRQSGSLWIELANRLLPEDTPLLGEARRLKDRRHELFVGAGSQAEGELREINIRLGELARQSENEFPWTAEEARDFRAGIAEQVLKIHDREKAAVEALEACLSGG